MILLNTAEQAHNSRIFFGHFFQKIFQVNILSRYVIGDRLNGNVLAFNGYGVACGKFHGSSGIFDIAVDFKLFIGIGDVCGEFGIGIFYFKCYPVFAFGYLVVKGKGINCSLADVNAVLIGAFDDGKSPVFLPSS